MKGPDSDGFYVLWLLLVSQDSGGDVCLFSVEERQLHIASLEHGRERAPID